MFEEPILYIYSCILINLLKNRCFEFQPVYAGIIFNQLCSNQRGIELYANVGIGKFLGLTNLYLNFFF